MSTYDDDALIAAAKEIVAASAPSKGRFHYPGEEELGSTHGFASSLSNVDEAHDPIKTSNHQVMVDRLTSEYPDDAREVTFSHWLRGVQVNHLIVRFFTDDGELTNAGWAALQLLAELAENAVLDEEHLAELEHDMAYQEVEALGLRFVKPDATGMRPADEEWVEKVMDLLPDLTPGFISETDVFRALEQLDLVDWELP